MKLQRGVLHTRETCFVAAISCLVGLAAWVVPAGAAAPAAACLPTLAAAGELTSACAEVQPGGLVKNENSEGPCTLNFLYLGSDGRRYIATAGHCLYNVDALAAKTWQPGHGPVAHNEDGDRIGEYAFWTMHYEWGVGGNTLKYARDMSLIRLDPKIRFAAELIHFGGPTGLNADIGSTPVILHSVGNGEGIGFLKETGTRLAPARTMVANAMPNAIGLGAIGYAYAGDSGSPVISDDGRAVALLVGLPHIGHSVTSGSPDVGVLELLRIPPMVAFAQKAMRLHLRLQTAPLR